MKRQHKHDGISLMISLGGSLLVLSIGLATLISITRSLEQSASLERSTKLFFAAESGIEAAFFHHNARGAGLDMTDGAVEYPATDFPQRIPHLSKTVNSEWTITSRKNTIVGLLKEGQSVQIPLFWDPSTNPYLAATQDGLGASPLDHFSLNFYKDSADMGTVQAEFEDKYGPVNVIGGTATFDFGKDNVSPNAEEILIDWSVTRKNNNEGVQTFSPQENDCSANEDFVCEDALRAANTAVADITGAVAVNVSALSSKDSKAGGRSGRVLPGLQVVTLQDFLECDDIASTGDSCSEYTLTFRPLLKFEHSVDGSKIPGIPYTITGDDGAPIAIPQGSYTVEATVREDDFAQVISFEVPERTSIGAFDYVIFD